MSTPLKYDWKIGVVKAVKDALTTGGVAVAGSFGVALSSPELGTAIMSAISTAIPPPWNAVALVGVPMLLKGVTNFLLNLRKTKKAIGRAELERAKAEYCGSIAPDGK